MNRIETVEVSLSKRDIIQSRAICNGQSKYHNEIIDLINKNMNMIMRAGKENDLIKK